MDELQNKKALDAQYDAILGELESIFIRGFNLYPAVYSVLDIIDSRLKKEFESACEMFDDIKKMPIRYRARLYYHIHDLLPNLPEVQGWKRTGSTKA